MPDLDSVHELLGIDYEDIPLTIKLPANFPHSATTPRFLFGNHVRWQSIAESQEDEIDQGVVIGSFYAYAPHRACWNWKYMILLDAESYSIAFCVADIAWEEHLEAITTTKEETS